MIKRRWAALFDLDGTLLDSIPLILASFHHACATVLGRTHAEADWISCIGKPLDIMMSAYSDDHHERARLSAAYRDYYTRNHDRQLRPFPNAVAIVRELAQDPTCTIGVVTGKSSVSAERALVFTGLRPFVSVLIGSDSCLRHKPEPEPVHLACERAGVDPSRTIFIGDSTLDVMAGNAAGVATVGVLWGASERRLLADVNPSYLAADFADLRSCIHTWATGLAAG
jgi:pyrophosphatase PpaX